MMDNITAQLGIQRSVMSMAELFAYINVLPLDGKLPFDAKKMLTYMITKGKYFLSICIRKN